MRFYGINKIRRVRNYAAGIICQDCKHFGRCTKSKRDGQYYAIDMKSKHGVLVNGIKINKETVLNDGDYITIGRTTLLFTTNDFPDRESALSHFKKVGERMRSTVID